MSDKWRGQVEALKLKSLIDQTDAIRAPRTQGGRPDYLLVNSVFSVSAHHSALAFVRLSKCTASEAVDVLRPFKKGSVSEWVLHSAQPNPESTYDYYRCDCTWRDLHAWLRSKGVRERKAIHALRKESGSLIASNFGIETADNIAAIATFVPTSSH